MTNDQPVSRCCECGTPICESMGTTLAGDVVEFLAGIRAGKDIRQGCPRCGTLWANLPHRKENSPT